MAWLSRIIFTCFLSLYMACTYAQIEQAIPYQASVLQQLALQNVKTGKNTNLNFPSSSNRLFLFVFLSPECPLCQQYSLSLNELAGRYEKQMTIIGIFPGKSYNRKTITAFLNKYNITFPAYIDESKTLTAYLGASVTPEVVLTSNDTAQLSLQYRGAIDDKVMALGVKRIKATNYYLKDAIDLFLSNKDIVTKRTDPVGCLINDY